MFRENTAEPFLNQVFRETFYTKKNHHHRYHEINFKQSSSDVSVDHFYP